MGRSSGAVARTPTIGVSTTPLRAGEGLWYNPLRMLKKGFTLVELLIVIVIIAILMAITFRIMGVSEDQTARQWTITRLHGLESAIGGYYAAFGSYPPVRLHGSRNIFCKLNQQGIQVVDQVVEGVLVWDRVRAACLSQPVAMSYPPCAHSAPLAKEISEELLDLAKKDQEFGSGSTARVPFDGLVKGDSGQPDINRVLDKKGEVEWTKLNLFKFGLMSFLLPRYIYMMQGPDTTMYDKFAQWGDNNNVPCKFEDGIPFDAWEDLARLSIPDENGNYNRDLWKVALMPSQIVTARWIPYLSEICFFYYGANSSYTTMWGVNLFNSQPMATWLDEPAFRTQTGSSVYSYILQNRLIRAAKSIRNGMPASEAALDSGFSDYSAFYRAFRKQFGTSPGRIRRPPGEEPGAVTLQTHGPDAGGQESRRQIDMARENG